MYVRSLKYLRKAKEHLTYSKHQLAFAHVLASI